MKGMLPIFNLSLAKLPLTEPDNLKRVRISIIFAIILLSLVKLLVALPVGLNNGQNLQVLRGAIFFIVFILLLKILLIDKRYARKVGVTMIWMAVSLIWSNAFITAQTIILTRWNRINFAL